MNHLGGMQNPHEVEQNCLLERIIKNAVSATRVGVVGCCTDL
jgi:hypothetical protein